MIINVHFVYRILVDDANERSCTQLNDLYTY